MRGGISMIFKNFVHGNRLIWPKKSLLIAYMSWKSPRKFSFDEHEGVGTLFVICMVWHTLETFP